MINGKKINKNDEWETPKELFDILNKKFVFTIDAACSINNCKVFEKHYDNLNRTWIKRPAFLGSEMDLDYVPNALIESWKNQRVFCNPPYSNKKQWIKKAIHEVENNKCPVVVMILPFTMEVFREIKNYKFDVLNKRVNFIDPETKKPTKGNTTGTVIVYFWGDIKID